MAGPGRSMLYSLLLFVIILSLMEMYRGKLASSELLTIAGGFISSLLFVLLLTFIGNYQESSGTRTGWGAVVLAESVALVAAGTVHRVCITTWIIDKMAMPSTAVLTLEFIVWLSCIFVYVYYQIGTFGWSPSLLIYIYMSFQVLIRCITISLIRLIDQRLAGPL